VAIKEEPPAPKGYAGGSRFCQLWQGFDGLESFSGLPIRMLTHPPFPDLNRN
jgi:hypothetical protein